MAIAKASRVLPLDPPAWKAGDHVTVIDTVIDGRLYPLSDGTQTIAHAVS